MIHSHRITLHTKDTARLRKAGAVRAAKGGATVNQLMALFDWLSPAMAKKYTDQADRRRLASQAMNLLVPVPPAATDFVPPK
jgi:hypothetical protein